MKPALIIINDKLLETGMSQIEIDHLMARFLEEEAFDFVEYISLYSRETKSNDSFTIH